MTEMTAIYVDGHKWLMFKLQESFQVGMRLAFQQGNFKRSA